MIRLVFADLTSTKAVWGGLLAIAVVFGYLGSWAVSIESTASQFDNLKNLGTVVVLFSSIAGVSLLVPLAQQAVSLKAKTYALWQIVGASPRTIRLIVLMQLFAIAIVGAAGGSAFEVLSYPLLFPLVFSSYNPPSNITLDLGLFNMPAVWFGAGILFVVGGYRAARRAANIPPVTVVRETEMPTKWRSPLRAAIGFLLVVAFSLYLCDLPDQLREGYFDYAMMVPLFATSIFAVASPWLLTAVLKLLNKGVSVSNIPGFIAARNALHQIEIAGSSEVSIMVGYGILSSFNVMTDVLTGYINRIGLTGLNTSLDWTSSIILFGGPVILSCTGAAVSSFLSFDSRKKDAAQYLSLGIRRSSLSVACLIEAAVHVVAAAAIGAMPAMLTGYLIGIPIGITPSFWRPLVGGGVVLGVGFILVALSILIQTLYGVRRSEGVGLVNGLSE